MKTASSATSTANTGPVNSPTVTERARGDGAERWFYSSRIALIFVALLVCVPHPLASWWGGSSNGPILFPLAIGTAWIALSWFVRSRADQSAPRHELYSGLSLTLDVVALSGLLSTSGAAQNPFTLLYFVPITLATVLAQKWTFRIAGLSVVGFTLLVVQTAVALEGHRHHPHHAHFFQHVKGMAVALAVAGGFVTFFVHRIARALSMQQARIMELSQEKERDHFAIALGALSAGAAHELGSPLGSVQLLAQELPHLEGAERDEAVATIVAEVQRMKSIVHSMDSSQLSAEILGNGSSWELRELAHLASGLNVACEVAAGLSTSQPKQIVLQIARELVRNALAVVGPESISLVVQARAGAEGFSIVVRDQGPGMSAEELLAAQEPFVSHSGRTGLGLFLSSIHARQLGGALEMESVPGEGTQVCLRLPAHPPNPAGRLRGSA